jgi:hypothetical protein
VADASAEPPKLVELAASEGWEIERTDALHRLFTRRRIRVALTHPARSALILETDRRGRLRDHQTYVPPNGGEIRYLHGAAAITQALQGTPPRGKTLNDLWQRDKRNGSRKR